MTVLESCPRCRTVLVPGQQKCAKCGSPTGDVAPAGEVAAGGGETRDCPACHRPAPAAANFCPDCGHAMNAPPHSAPPSAIPPPPDAGLTPTPFAAPRKPGARTYLVLALVAAVIVGLCGIGYVGQNVLFGPEAAVKGYFGALADRDAKAALGYLATGNAGDEYGNRKLLTDAVLKDKGYTPPADVTIKKIDEAKGYPSGDTNGDPPPRVADIDFRIGDQKYQTQLSLLREEKTSYGVFHEWRVVGGLSPLVVIAAAGAPVKVNGVATPVSSPNSETRDVPAAFLGRYSVALADNPLLEADGKTVDVSPKGGEVTLDVQLKDSAREATEEQVKAYLDECAESTDLEPQNCPFSAYSYSTITDVKWTIVEYPPIKVELQPEGLVVVYTDGYEYGTAKVTGKDAGHKFSQEITFQVSGTVSVFKGDIVFAPAG